METNIRFNSAICTSREQSERLLELGLKKETADMMYITSVVDGLGKWLPEEYRYYRLEIGEYHKPIGKGMLHIPAWSLHRLMLIANANDTAFLNVENMYETLIKMIASNIKYGYFNKDYLEEKK